MNMRKSSGPKTDPWGTPLTTAYRQLTRYLPIQNYLLHSVTQESRDPLPGVPTSRVPPMRHLWTHWADMWAWATGLEPSPNKKKYVMMFEWNRMLLLHLSSLLYSSLATLHNQKNTTCKGCLCWLKISIQFYSHHIQIPPGFQETFHQPRVLPFSDEFSLSVSRKIDVK